MLTSLLWFAAIVVAAIMCVLVLVLLALFLVQRHRQGTNTPSLIPGLAAGLGKGGRHGKGGWWGSRKRQNPQALEPSPQEQLLQPGCQPQRVRTPHTGQ